MLPQKCFLSSVVEMLPSDIQSATEMGPPKSDRSGRVPFAAGDFLIRSKEPHSYDLLIDAPFEKPGWKRRMLAEDGKMTFPGSAVLFENRYYEIIDDEVDHKSGRHFYYLKSWEERFPIRVQFPYTKGECERLAQQRRENAEKSTRTALIRMFMPVVGLLPAAEQNKIQNEYGIPSVRMTTWSSLVFFVIGAFSTIMTLAAMFTGMDVSPLLRLGCYFFLESAVRLVECWKLDEPSGSVPVVFAVEVYKTIRRQFDPVYRQKTLENMNSSRHDHFYRNAMDEVKVLDSSGDLEIVSDLPKPHWNLMTGIQYQDHWYGLIESSSAFRQEKMRYVFKLRKAPEGTVFRSTTNYTPDEIRNLYREKRKLENQTWVDTFSLFWGLLPEADQRMMSEIYTYDGVKYTKWTSIALGLFGLGSSVASLVSLFSGFHMASEFLWLFPSGYLLLESSLRWRSAAQGNPEGSVFGVLFHPFAVRLLRT